MLLLAVRLVPGRSKYLARNAGFHVVHAAQSKVRVLHSCLDSRARCFFGTFTCFYCNNLFTFRVIDILEKKDSPIVAFKVLQVR